MSVKPPTAPTPPITIAPRVLPPSGGTLIARQRLLDALAGARQPRCVVLQAPAGSGKTSVLAVWRRELVGMGVEVAWAALREDDHDAARLCDALLAAFGSVAPTLVQEATALAGRGDDAQALERFVIALVRGLAAFGRRVVLVIDDTHHLTDPRAWEALQLLLDYAPAHLQCAFASRQPLPLSLARLRAQQQVLEIGFEELRFTEAESVQMLLAGQGGRIDERQARSLHAQTNGWAAGLKLLSMDVRQAGAAVRTGPTGERIQDPHAFGRYFEREVLARLPAPQRELLVRCALPERFNAALCAALLQDNDKATVARSADLLAQLVTEGLFLAPAEARLGDGWWRMHPLLRDVLAAHLRALPEARLKALHTVAWHWFEARGMHSEAVQHALLAGEAASAADIVEACAGSLFVAGDLRHLVGMVRHLPDAIVRERAGLRLWMAWVEVCEHRLDACVRSIAQLSQDMHAAPPAEAFRLTMLRGLYAVQRDDLAAVAALLPELLAAPPDADPMMLSGRRNLLTWIYLSRGEYERARSVQIDEPAPAIDGKPLLGTPFGLLGGRCLVGLTHAVQGQVIQAERIYRDVLFEAERAGTSCIDPACMAVGLLADVLCELNEPAETARLLEDRIEVLERVSIPDTLGRCALALVRSRWLLGRPMDSFAYLEYLEDQFEQRGLDRLRAYFLLEQMQLHLRLNEAAAARVLLPRLEALAARHVPVPDATLSDTPQVVERARMLLSLHGGELHAAAARLQPLVQWFEARGRGRIAAHLRMQYAVVLHRLGQAAQASEQLQEALRLGHRLGLVRTLLDAHEDVPLLLREAIATPGFDPVLVFYAERLEAAARLTRTSTSGPAPEAAASTPTGILSPREADIAQLLTQAMSNKKIARALDLSVDTVKWHLKNIYAKLGVSGRDGVVERLRAAAQRT